MDPSLTFKGVIIIEYKKQALKEAKKKPKRISSVDG